MTPQMIQTLTVMRNEAAQTVPVMFANINTLLKQGQTNQPAFVEAILGACVGILTMNAIDMIGNNQPLNGMALLEALRNAMPFNIWSVANQNGLTTKALEITMGRFQQMGLIGQPMNNMTVNMGNSMFGGNFQQPTFGGGGTSVGMLTSTTYNAPQGPVNPGSIQSSGKFGSTTVPVSQPATQATTFQAPATFGTYTPVSTTTTPAASTPTTKPIQSINNYVLAKGLSAVANSNGGIDIVGFEDKDNPSRPISYKELVMDKKSIGEVMNAMFYSGRLGEEPLEPGQLIKLSISHKVTDVSTIKDKKYPYYDRYFTSYANLYFYLAAGKRIGDFVTDYDDAISYANEKISNAKNRTYLLEKLDVLKTNYRNNKEECLKVLSGRFENTIKYVTAVEQEALILYLPEVMEAFTNCTLGTKFVLNLTRYSYPTLFKALKEANAHNSTFYLITPLGYLAFNVLSSHDLDNSHEEEFKLCLVYSTISGIE